MRATISVPATSANLGAGFDVFGLALDLVNELTVDTVARGVRWEGEGAGRLPVDGSDLVSRTIAGVARGMGVPVPVHGLSGVNRVPLERGLGSSSAATVAGVVAASLLLDLGWERDPWSVFAAAAEVEGHPDNVAPAVFGGFTIAMPDGFVHRLDPHPDLRLVIIVPPLTLSTDDARRALPAEVSRADAVFNVAHAALTVEALVADPGLLGRALADRLHQDARIEMAGTGEAADALRTSRIPFCVSGAGPSLLAFEGDTPVDVGMLGVSSDWRILRPGVRSQGFTVDHG